MKSCDEHVSVVEKWSWQKAEKPSLHTHFLRNLKKGCCLPLTNFLSHTGKVKEWLIIR